jgi:hypothetical protein
LAVEAGLFVGAGDVCPDAAITVEATELTVYNLDRLCFALGTPSAGTAGLAGHHNGAAFWAGTQAALGLRGAGSVPFVSLRAGLRRATTQPDLPEADARTPRQRDRG